MRKHSKKPRETRVLLLERNSLAVQIADTVARDLELASSSARVCNSGSLFLVKRLLFVFAGNIPPVRYSGVSAGLQLAVNTDLKFFVSY